MRTGPREAQGGCSLLMWGAPVRLNGTPVELDTLRRGERVSLENRLISGARWSEPQHEGWSRHATAYTDSGEVIGPVEVLDRAAGPARPRGELPDPPALASGLVPRLPVRVFAVRVGGVRWAYRVLPAGRDIGAGLGSEPAPGPFPGAAGETRR